MITRLVNNEFSRYLIVGGIAFLCDFTTLVLLTEIFQLHYIHSATIAFLLGTIINYCLSIQWVFKFRRIDKPFHEFTIFFFIGVIGVIFNALFMYIFVEFIYIQYTFAKCLTTILILFFNFGMRKLLLFSTIKTLSSYQTRSSNTD